MSERGRTDGPGSDTDVDRVTNPATAQPRPKSVRSSRDQILVRTARALAHHVKVPHPGRLQAPAPTSPPAEFTQHFSLAGGEVVLPEAGRDPGEWLTEFLGAIRPRVEKVVVAPGVPKTLHPDFPTATPEHADVGVVITTGAAAETGSLILGSEGRASQLLPPILIAWLPPDRIFPRLEDALLAHQPDLPATLALHSGPSKSADIGRTVVTGVHGPGRCIAVLIPK